MDVYIYPCMYNSSVTSNYYNQADTMAVWLLFKGCLTLMSSDKIIRLHKIHQKAGILLKQSMLLLNSPKMLADEAAGCRPDSDGAPPGAGMRSVVSCCIVSVTDGAVWRLYLFIYSLDTLDINSTSHQFHKFSVLTTDYCDCMLYDCDKAKISCIFKMSCFLTY